MLLWAQYNELRPFLVQNGRWRLVMRPGGSVTHWIHDVRDGDPEAVQRLWERYFQRLVGLAQTKLKSGQRRVSDEEDVASRVFQLFHHAISHGRYPQLSDRDGLWRLLIRMTARVAIDQQRKQHRVRRGGGRVRGESALGGQGAVAADPFGQVVGTDPTPEFLASIREQLTNLLNALESPHLQELAIAKMEGYTNSELATRFNCSERTVERRIRLIRTKLDTESHESD
jgi:RNA polymerase sigma factor (sigma-70 family)